MPTTPPASTRTVDRALALLAAVVAQPRLSLAEAARATDLPASTALRLLRSLEAAGFVDRQEEGEYRPGARLIQLGAQAFSREPLVRLARAPMDSVAESTGESVYLSLRNGAQEAVYIAIVEGTHSVRHASWVGRTVPLEGTAVGEVYRGEVPPGGYTHGGHSVEQDVTALSSPVIVGGRVVAALSALVPDYRCTAEHAERCGRALADATTRLARALGEEAPPEDAD
ncbi:IclR family transcriptional regulator [Micrococcus porci]|uniref:IclR family transcriptional regulator n=1 Tax=Micrococcus porci TaxID=2856555 RepID=UPI003CF567F1